MERNSDCFEPQDRALFEGSRSPGTVLGPLVAVCVCMRERREALSVEVTGPTRSFKLVVSESVMCVL